MDLAPPEPQDGTAMEMMWKPAGTDADANRCEDVKAFRARVARVTPRERVLACHAMHYEIGMMIADTAAPLPER